MLQRVGTTSSCFCPKVHFFPLVVFHFVANWIAVKTNPRKKKRWRMPK